MISNAPRALIVVLVTMLNVLLASPASAASGSELQNASKAALQNLIATVPAAQSLNAKAVAVLVFPSITKAGFIVGGQYGEGVLWRKGKASGYFSTAGASYGLQAGAQTYGYAMFFMRESALNALTDADGFEVGVGPSVVVMDQGMAKTATTTTLQDDIYAFIFGQSGLMAGVGVQGNKITAIDK
jgi:lipid-binding SYLF domain-containing protein